KQALLGFGDQLAVRVLLDEIAIFLFRTRGMREVAIGLLHLAIMDVGDLELGFRRFRHVREEGLEVLVFVFGLCERGGATFGVPRVANRQLGASDKLGIWISVDEGLQREARDVVLAGFHRLHGAVEEDLVGLFGIHRRDGILDLFIAAGTQREEHDEDAENGTNAFEHYLPLNRVAICALTQTTVSALYLLPGRLRCRFEEQLRLLFWAAVAKHC